MGCHNPSYTGVSDECNGVLDECNGVLDECNWGVG